jgi:hypothetical protein
LNEAWAVYKNSIGEFHCIEEESTSPYFLVLWELPSKILTFNYFLNEE